MRILVTGGAGFVGSHVVGELARAHEVLVVDSLDPYYDPAWKRRRLERLLAEAGVAWHQTDICDLERLRESFQSWRPELVFHLAAVPGVMPSLARPGHYVDVDVKGTVNLLALAAEHEVGRFVFVSSSSVYGPDVSGPCREEDPLRPVSPYAAAKVAGETFARMYERLHGVPVTVVRPFTVYGPEQRPDMALYQWAQAIQAGQPITLYRDAVGEAVGRDYTYVRDVADGIVRAGLLPQAAHQTYNIGRGQFVRTSEVVAALETAFGQRAHVKWRGLPKGDVAKTWADTTKAEQELGFRAQVDVPDGVRAFAAWYGQGGGKV